MLLTFIHNLYISSILLYTHEKLFHGFNTVNSQLSTTVLSASIPGKKLYYTSRQPQNICYKKVIEELDIIKNNQKIILRNICGIYELFPEKNPKKESDVKFFTLEKFLPINTLDRLNYVEELLNNRTVYEQMVSMLSCVGGVNYDSGIKHMLRKLMTNELAMQFSYLGIRGKRPFKNLNLNKAIFDSVRTYKLWKDCTDHNIEQNVSNWLRHARTRHEHKTQKN